MLLKSCTDYPILIRAMVGRRGSTHTLSGSGAQGGTCGHAITRALLCRLQESVHRSVDATLRLCAHFGGGQAVEAREVGARVAALSEYDVLVEGVLGGVGSALDSIAFFGEFLQQEGQLKEGAAAPVAGGGGACLGSPLWKAIANLLLRGSGAEGGGEDATPASAPAHLTTMTHLATATLHCLFVLWRVHTQDCASVALAAPLALPTPSKAQRSPAPPARAPPHSPALVTLPCPPWSLPPLPPSRAQVQGHWHWGAGSAWGAGVG